MTDETAEIRRAYSKGYSAGRRRRDRDRYRADVRNDRLTALAASIMAAAMQGSWGSTDAAGNFKKHDMHGLERMAAASAERLCQRLPVYEE